jgi:hypothetical protein
VNAFLKNKYYLFLYPVIAFLFLLISSTSTSPLYPVYNGDGALYLLMGKLILNGKILYKDIFDHKGPVLFFIQAAGQLIGSGKTGIFILQIINLSSVLFIIRKICLYFIQPAQIIFIFLSIFFLLYMTIGDGNKSEEFCLLLIFIPLLFAFRFCFSDYAKHPAIYSFIYGICFAITAFIRINNAAVTVAVIIATSIYIVSEKQYKNLFLNILFFLSGFLIICLPIFIYFYFKNALDDMIYATFLHNLKYASKDTYKIKLIVLLSFIITFFGIINTLVYKRKNKKDSILQTIIILGSIFTFISTNFGTKYFLYYHILDIPILTLGILLYIHNSNKKLSDKTKKRFIILIIIAGIIPMTYYSFNRTIDLYKTYFFDHSLLNYPTYPIPSEDKNNALGYNVNSRWYLEQNIIPSYKYFTLQEWFAKTDPQILIDFNEHITQKPPKWLMVRSDSYTSNPTLNALLKERYEVKAVVPERPDIKHVINYDNLGYTLYRLKE